MSVRSIAQHWQGTNAYIYISRREAAGELVFVSQEEAERRAKICTSGNGGLKCPRNQLLHKNMMERLQDTVIARKLDGRTTSKDNKLGSCSVCSCELRTLVHMLPEVIMHGVDEEEYLHNHPSFCWKQQFKPK